jgi:hypothetical protein
VIDGDISAAILPMPTISPASGSPMLRWQPDMVTQNIERRVALLPLDPGQCRSRRLPREAGDRPGEAADGWQLKSPAGRRARRDGSACRQGGGMPASA